MLIEPRAEITCQPDIVKLIALVESVNSLSASHVASNHILIFFQRVTRDVFKMLTDELRLFSHYCLPWITILAFAPNRRRFPELFDSDFDIFDALTRQKQNSDLFSRYSTSLSILHVLQMLMQECFTSNSIKGTVRLSRKLKRLLFRDFYMAT